MGSSPPGSPFHGIYRQEYWSGLLFPSLGDLPDPGIKPLSPAWLVDSLPLRHLGSPNELGFGSKELLCGFWKTIRFLSKWKEESEVAQSCSTFCNPMDCSPPGFSIHGIFQARILFPSPGDLPDPGIEPGSPTLQADAFLYKMWWELADRIITLFCIFFFYSLHWICYNITSVLCFGLLATIHVGS